MLACSGDVKKNHSVNETCTSTCIATHVNRVSSFNMACLSTIANQHIAMFHGSVNRRETDVLAAVRRR